MSVLSKDLVYLVLQYLNEEGYQATARKYMVSLAQIALSFCLINLVRAVFLPLLWLTPLNFAF